MGYIQFNFVLYPKKRVNMPKIIRKLSEAQIRNAKPKEKAYKLYDEGGLRLLIRSTGTKVWQYPYKLHGKSNIYTIGQYDPNGRKGFVGMAAARKKRDEVREMLNQGINPNKVKAAERLKVGAENSTSFEFTAREWHSKQNWVPKHARNILMTLEKDVFPLIGHIQIDRLSTQDVLAVISGIEERGALDVAKRVCQRCESIFDYAILKGICQINPAAGRSKFVQSRKVKHRPHLKEEQLPEFLNKLDVYQGREYIKLAMKFLVLTFVRPGELRHGRWDEIDEELALWRIPAERMKMSRDHIVPLSKQALEVLAQLKECTTADGLLFPGVRDSRKPISDVTLIKVLKIMGYDGDNKVVPHGMRHTASTILNEKRFAGDVIERQLAHVDKNKVRGIYNHAEYLDERREMMQWWADHLDELKGI